MEALENREVLSPANDAFTNGAFQALLGRLPDAATRSSISTALDNGQLTPLQVVQGLQSTPDFRNTVVANLYQKILRRQVDPMGQAAFSQFLAGGGTVGQLEAFLYSSDEFFNRAGGNNTAWVNAVFTNAFNRPVDAASLTGFLAGLGDRNDRLEVARFITGSREAALNETKNLFQGLLGRSADPLGLAVFSGALQNGARDADVVAILLSSPEAVSRLQRTANANPVLTF